MSTDSTPKKSTSEKILKDSEFTKPSALDTSYKQIKSVTDPRFGDITILQNPETRQVLGVREKKVSDKKEASRLISSARNRMNLKHPNLINLVDYSVRKQAELCSTFYIVKYYFEYPKSDLRKQIIDREKKGNQFTGSELTHLLYQQVGVQGYLQSQGLCHGDIQPVFIGYDPEAQESKLMDKSEGGVTEASIIQTQKNRLISGQPLYQSPTMFANLKKGNLRFQFDKNKEDVFALGLVLLETGNDKSVQNIYNLKTGEMDLNALEKHTDEFNRKFGQENTLLASHVVSLTNPNENTRPSALQVQSALPPYEEVKKYLNKGRVSNNLRQQGIILPSGSVVKTETVIQGGDSKTVVVSKGEMPDVDADLFNLDLKANPYLVESQKQTWDNNAGDQTSQVISVPPITFKFKQRDSGTKVSSSQSNTGETKPTEKSLANPVAKQGLIIHETPTKTGTTLVYADTSNYKQSDAIVQERYAYNTGQTNNISPTPLVQQGTIPSSTFSPSQFDSKIVTSMIPEIKHEFHKSDSSVVEPVVIKGFNYLSTAGKPRTVSPEVISIPQTNQYMTSSSVIFQDVPKTKMHPGIFPTETTFQSQVFAETPQSTMGYSRGQFQTSVNEIPNMDYKQREGETGSQPNYGFRDSTDTPVYSNSYQSLPKNPYTTHESIGMAAQESYNTPQKDITSQKNNYSRMKLVRNYSDSRLATDTPNY